ncbi:low molecular weight phosphatase family protein [Tepidiforma sp.]|uniref:arsenate-mycothiol transferase ArsC n=1 Tax=Tepidiforma sp. TaxID=2682230 RepID=UPI0021DC0F09|nr:arsenate reductase ArsC [Tepidiforma sp.]MCX7617853.1 arsenate reductase ArsC [Tepidiforma sp.]GIW18969.1 MAG: low molecular weight phosphatase family protein [Tepidiforma sp.]
MAALSLTPAEEGELRLRIRREAEALAREFAGIFSIETIERYVNESFDAIRGRARLLDFVPVFVHRYTRERLRALAQAEGLVTKDRPEVLYVCVHNAGRSQIAAALTAQLSGGAVAVRSAGSDPADEINPAVVAILAERGIDLSQEFPKPLADELVRAADVVITMGCGDACPIYPGKRYMDWEVPDPAGQPREVVEAIVADIEGRVRKLLEELGVPAIS